MEPSPRSPLDLKWLGGLTPTHRLEEEGPTKYPNGFVGTVPQVSCGTTESADGIFCVNFLIRFGPANYISHEGQFFV